MEADNHGGAGAGVSWPDHQRHYLIWVEQTEMHLRCIFTDPTVWDGLYTERHWQIRAITNPKLRPFVLVQHELQDQSDRLNAIRARVARLTARARGLPGVLAVLDTHVLLHYVPPDQVDWQSVVGRSPVRLVVPLRVVEELDEKKYTARDDRIASRARGVVSRLRTLLLPTTGEPATLIRGVTIEVPLIDEPRRRTLDADEEILETCIDLRAAGADICLVTGDAGLAIRAAALGITPVDMTTKYARRRLAPPEEDGTATDP